MPRGALYWPVTREQFDVSDAASAVLLHLEASDAETDALVAGRWVTALAFDFQHFGQLFGPRNNGGTTQEQKAEQTPEHKNAKKRDVHGFSLNAKWKRGGRK